MDEKIKWFGRYLGCNISVQGYKNSMALIGLDSDNVTDWCFVKNNHPQMLDDCVLILKELKDITEEDFTALIDEVWHNIDYDTIQINRCDNRIEAELWSDTDEDYTDGCSQTSLHFGQDEYDYDVVDFLRSKGYAIGIPKEYYITEEELNGK